MKVENQVQPSPEQVKTFLSEEGPVCMVNLLKFREKAAYPDGRDPDVSGEEAYMRYGRVMTRLVQEAGGRVVFAADVKSLLLGEVESLWDEVAIVEYPSSKTLIEISSTPEFQEIQVHRVAGLEGQLNLTTRERTFD